jgi:hypothetical protein
LLGERELFEKGIAYTATLKTLKADVERRII